MVRATLPGPLKISMRSTAAICFESNRVIVSNKFQLQRCGRSHPSSPVKFNLEFSTVGRMTNVRWELRQHVLAFYYVATWVVDDVSVASHHGNVSVSLLSRDSSVCLLLLSFLQRVSKALY